MMRNAKMMWVICDCCEGHGKVDHPAFSNGITSSEWADMSFDDRDNYMRGDYDVKCGECKGAGKVEVPDVSRMTFGEKRVLVKQRREEAEEADDLRAMHAEMDAERRFGC